MDASNSEYSILQSLPKRKQIIEEKTSFFPPPMISPLTFKTKYSKVVVQLFKWTFATFFFLLGILWDKIWRRDSAKNRGRRLRKTLEWMGGTMVKIGQQLSLRIDLLPYELCEELTQMLDQRPPFASIIAIQRVEALTGRKLKEDFAVFDPNPIGSASIACVYQAKLKDGSHVAVKVRRPGIGELFTADFLALDIICFLLEFFTILRPGFTKSFREGLKHALLEELDFRKEARYQALFRQSAKESKVRFISAPRVFSNLSGSDVLVMEYVDGLLLSEVLAIVERKDSKGKAILQERKIKPKKVAQRLLRASHMAMISELFFHSDPSPANIIVQNKSKLVFIDFGACGSFSQSQKRLLRQINYYQFKGDTEGMTRSTIGLLQPLPPIDVDQFSDEVERIYRSSVYAMADQNSEWWERTTAVHWLSFMGVVKKYNIPIPMGLISMVRSTMLYDTISARLDNSINFYEVFRRHEAFAGKMARERVLGKLRENLDGSPDPTYYLRYEQLIDTGNRLLFTIQGILDNSPIRFERKVSKGYFFVGLIIRFSAIMIGMTTMLVLSIWTLTSNEDLGANFGNILSFLVSNFWYQLFLLCSVLLLTRRILFRFDDKDFK